MHTRTSTVGSMSVSAAGLSPGSPWQDVSIPIQRRVLALVSNMTTEEKISQLSSNSPAIDHLGISAFNWWTGQNCLLHSFHVKTNMGGTVCCKHHACSLMFSGLDISTAQMAGAMQVVLCTKVSVCLWLILSGDTSPCTRMIHSAYNFNKSIAAQMLQGHLGTVHTLWRHINHVQHC